MITLHLIFFYGVSISLLVSCFFMMNFIKQLGKNYHHIASSNVELQRELKIINTANVGLGKALLSISNKANIIAENQKHEKYTNYEEKVYDHAKRITKMGANIDELAKTCGITKAEAELIIAMENTKSAPVFIKDNTCKPLQRKLKHA